MAMSSLGIISASFVAALLVTLLGTLTTAWWTMPPTWNGDLRTPEELAFLAYIARHGASGGPPVVRRYRENYYAHWKSRFTMSSMWIFPVAFVATLLICAAGERWWGW